MKTREVSCRVDNEQTTAVMRTTRPVPEIGPWLGTVYAAVGQAVAVGGATIVGPPFARYHRVGGGGNFEIEAGFPVDREIDRTGDVFSSVLPAGAVATTFHIGPYDAMEPTYEALFEWVRAHDAEPAGDPWEVYLTDPSAEPDPTMWRTEVVLPYRPHGRRET
jgi:effector-binding domain-containing protein